MSIFRGIAGALGGNSGSRVIQSIIERISNKSQPVRVKNKYGGTVGRDPNYKPPTEQINTQPDTSSVSGFRAESANRRQEARKKFPLGFSARSFFAGLGGNPKVFDTASGTPRATADSSATIMPQNVDANIMQPQEELTNVPPQQSSLVS